jgi:hypothetical protein
MKAIQINAIIGALRCIAMDLSFVEAMAQEENLTKEKFLERLLKGFEVSFRDSMKFVTAPEMCRKYRSTKEQLEERAARQNSMTLEYAKRIVEVIFQEIK